MSPTDPTESGGLFTRRTSGTRPVRYRRAPVTGGRSRQTIDQVVAAGLLAVEALLCLTIFGPQPYGWFWVGSQVQYLTDSISAGIATIMLGSLTTLMLTVLIMKRVDEAWKLVRRAVGHRQEGGAIETIFAVCVGIAVIGFTFWFLILTGPSPTIAPQN